MSVPDVVAALSKHQVNRSLVISGGEPFLQQKGLVPLLRQLRTEGWWVEVETNGTVLPRADFIDLVSQVNCSPKLANSLDPLKLRIRSSTLHALSEIPKVNFKFVIADPTDLEEVLSLVTTYRFKEVRLMPECRTQEELIDKSNWLRAICDKHGFIFCTRLSIMMSGTERGV